MSVLIQSLNFRRPKEKKYFRFLFQKVLFIFISFHSFFGTAATRIEHDISPISTINMHRIEGVTFFNSAAFFSLHASHHFGCFR